MKIESGAGKSIILKKRIIFLNTKERINRSFKNAGLYFVLSVVSILIPVLHFVLVPLFLGLTVFVGVSQFKNNKQIDLSDVNCPVCDNKLKESTVYFHRESVRLYCYECRNHLLVS